MDERVGLSALASLVVLAAAGAIFYLTDRERGRAAGLFAKHEAIRRRAETDDPASVLAAVGGRVPGGVRRVVDRLSLPFGSHIDEGSQAAWLQARAGLTVLLAVLGVVSSLALGSAWPMAITLGAPWLATVTVRRSLRGAAARRRERIDREFATALDIIVLAMEAGLPFERAMSAYTTSRVTALTSELGITARELEVGYRRREALQRLVDRTGSGRLTTFAGTVRIAEQFGSPLAEQLRTLATEFRSDRKIRLQAMALRAPVTMLLPTAGFILPPIFAIVMGPMALRLASGSLF